MKCGKVKMETENPFSETINEKQVEILGFIMNFWKLVPQVVGMMMDDEYTEQLGTLADKFRSQVLEMMSWFSKTDHRPVTVNEFYRIIFLMRESTQPLVIELEQVAEQRNIDLAVPTVQGDEIIPIKLSEWIPKRIINH